MLWGANVSPQSKKFNFVLHKITPAILAWFDLEKSAQNYCFPGIDS